MKQITKNTLLKQGDITYQPIEVDGIIYWWNEIDNDEIQKNLYIFGHDEGLSQIEYKNYVKDNAVAQSLLKLVGVPVIDVINSWRYKQINTNPNQYTQKDIEKAIELAREKTMTVIGNAKKYSKKEILEQINQISIIEIDEQFNITSYE